MFKSKSKKKILKITFNEQKIAGTDKTLFRGILVRTVHIATR